MVGRTTFTVSDVELVLETLSLLINVSEVDHTERLGLDNAHDHDPLPLIVV